MTRELSIRNSAGFTLLEVLLALTILALVAIPTLQATRENIVNTHALKQKAVARWVADNEMEQIHLEGRWPGLQWSKQTREFSGQEWHVRRRSVETASDDFRMIEVDVRLSPDTTEPTLASLQSYMFRR
ncbi:type II secretion system minor pseudopilin GspI [Parendozoicomonas haliclonae]|uniref:Type II secretion system protein I n=1 Tax=Parendozoicomonas haliclonae TaxID=1960125 RepID=A0A1X7AH11_9GAMM|nr:type II secretion system minor pseudopilin GspI [Parendozoicomonas haliclonae]SMA39496.1 Bacterial type II secretion system protein I/J [Parendozoicomonas haliclonae]